MNQYLGQDLDFSDRILPYLEQNKNISDKTFSETIYTNYFKEVFHEKINSLYSKDTEAEVELKIKDKNIRLTFEKDECVQEERQLEIFNSSIYIDDPFVLDEMNNDSLYGRIGCSIHKKNILHKLIKKEIKQ